MRTQILNVPFDIVTRRQALVKLIDYCSKSGHKTVFTPNPEMVMLAQKDKEFAKILASGDLVVADGIGVVIASKMRPPVLPERVPGCDLIFDLFKTVKASTVYLLGAKPGVCEAAKANIEADFKNITVVGYHHGYFNAEDEKLILDDIKSKNPDILLVGLGFPGQEKWIYQHKDELPVKVSMGIGGSLDVLAKTVKRAPVFMQKMGLEWFYRLLKQPSRIGRMMCLPLFILKVMFSGNK